MKCLSVLLMTCLVFSTMAQSKKKQIEMLTVSKDSIQSLLDKERDAHVLSKTTLTNQIAELNHQISDLNSKSETQNARIANLESQLKKLETRVDSLKTSLSDTKVHLDEANRTINSNEEIINNLESKYKNLEAENDNLSQQNSILKEKNDELQIQVETAEKSVAVAHDTISVLQKKIKSLIKANPMVLFQHCEAEYSRCLQSCNIEVVIGANIAIGSYIKVYWHENPAYPDGGLITEGYIVNHISGNIFIVPSLDDANNSNICGGCCDGTYSIDFDKKQVWGC